MVYAASPSLQGIADNIGYESMYDDIFIEGNVRTRSLAEFWNDPNASRNNSDIDSSMLTGACAECTFGP